MNYSNYRSNMPHYDSMPYNYNPMGINDNNISHDTMYMTNAPIMQGILESMNQQPFIPDTEMPFTIDGDMPALPRIPLTGMPEMLEPAIPQTPTQQPMPQMPMQEPEIPELPWMPEMQPGMPQIPGMPGMQQPMQPGMPGMPGMQQPMQPGMPGMQQPMQPGMPQMPLDGNMYPFMPMTMDCEQLREMMRRMNCPMNNMNDRNETRPMQPENITTPSTPPANNMLNNRLDNSTTNR